MNILFTRFPLESANGGAENQTINLMEGLIAHGHDITFLGSCPVLLKRCRELRITNYELRIGPPPVTKWGAISFFWKKRKIQKSFSFQLSAFSSQPDVICMLSLTEKILLTPLALKKDIKVLWIEHDNVGNWLTKNPSLPLLKKLSAQVTTVCVSDLSAEIFRSLGYKNVVAIPNGVKEAERGKLKEPACRQGRERDDGILRIGCIARLSPEKGVDVLIAAMKQVPDATLLVVGKGPQYVQSSKNVTLRYEVPDIEQVYSQIDVLVLPSREEDPFGLVVAEAMMRGIAVICTDACGIAGYLTDGQDALIVPAGSTEALVEAIERFQVSGFREQVATAGKKAAREKFSVERMVKDYESQITNHTV